MSGASVGGTLVESGSTDVVRVVFPSLPPPPLPQELQQTSIAPPTLPALPLPVQRGVQMQAAAVLRRAVSGTKGAHCRHGSSSGGGGPLRRPLPPSHHALEALSCDPHVAELLSAAFWWCFLEDYESVPLVPGVDGPPAPAPAAAAAAASTAAADPSSRPAGGPGSPPLQAPQQPASLKPVPPQRGSGGGGGGGGARCNGAPAAAPVPPSPRGSAGSHACTSHLTAHGHRAAWVGRHSGGSPKEKQRVKDRQRLSLTALLPELESAVAAVTELAAATATATATAAAADANDDGSDTGSDCDERERALVAKSFGEYNDDWEFFLTAVGRRRRRSSASEGVATCPSSVPDDDASRPSPAGAALPSPPATARASTALPPPTLWSPAQRQDILFGKMACAYAKAVIPLACRSGGCGGASAAATRAWRLLPDVLARALDAALREALPYAVAAHMGTPAAEVRRLTRRTTYWLHGVEHAPPSCAPPRSGRHNRNSNSNSSGNITCEPSQPLDLSPAADATSDAPTDPAPTDTAAPAVPVPATATAAAVADPTLPPATVSLKALRAEFAAVLHPRAKGGGSGGGGGGGGGGGEGGSSRSLALHGADPLDDSALAFSPHTMPQPLCPWYETGRRSAAAQTRRKQATGYFSTDTMSPLLHRYAADHGKRAADAPRPSEMRWVLS